MEHAHELMLRYRVAPLDMSPCEFRKLGQQVAEQLAEFLCTLPDRPVNPDGATDEALDTLAALDASVALPEDGADARELLAETTRLLCEHVTFSGHPRFMDVSASSPAPIGSLAEFLAAAVNARGGGRAAESLVGQIEAQTIRWLAEMLGYPIDCGGLLLGGDHQGNIAAMLAARTAKVPWDVRGSGLAAGPAHKLRLYASQEAHSWIERAAELLGLGRATIRRVPVNGRHGMDHRALHRMLQEDTDAGLLPFLVIGTAGTWQAGGVDPLLELASICHAYKLWFHVDGTYGGCAALLLDQPDAIAVPDDLRGIRVADSLALDAHRWLYAPRDTSFLLVRNPDLSWYDSLDNGRGYAHNDGDEDDAAWLCTNGFHALDVWLALRQVGRKGYVEMLSADIELARILDQLVREQAELQPGTQSLSITTFRYVPSDLTNGDPELERYLERLNRRLLARLRQNGDALLSGVTVSGTFMLRAGIVNFRTSLEDIEALVTSVMHLGRDVDAELRPTWM